MTLIYEGKKKKEKEKERREKRRRGGGGGGGEWGIVKVLGVDDWWLLEAECVYEEILCFNVCV